MRRAPEHPLAPPGGLLSEARASLYDRIGPGPHPCHWCGKVCEWVIGRRGQPADALVADHVNADPTDDRPENLVAACGACNGTRHHAVTDDEPHVVRAGIRHRAVEIACERCGKAVLTEASGHRTRPRRFCSRSCARSAPRV